MACEVEYTDEFESWWNELSEPEQESVAATVGMLEAKGTSLGYPHSSSIEGSKFNHMRELRVQHGGDPYRVFYAFDPRRAAILLVAGCKAGDDRFYEHMIPKADKSYEAHLKQLKEESDSRRR